VGGNNVLDEYFTWPTELVAVVNMLHILSYGHQGGSEGGDNVLEEYNTWPRELVSVVRTKRYSWAYSWTWRHNVALIRLVGVCCRGVAESTLALRLQEEKRHGWVDVCMG